MGFLDGLDRTVGGFLPGGPTPGEVRYRETYPGIVTGTASAATLGTLGAAGTLIPGGARPSQAGEIFRNAFSLGNRGHFDVDTDDGPQRRTWADLGPFFADRAADVPGDIAQGVGEQAANVAGGFLKGIGPAALAAAAVAAAVVLNR